jgi:alkylhydroperoxidase/carboxymuconolactone decarboxylase family protein YurZ
VSSQSNDKFGVYWDSEMAKVHGATEQEISEAVEMAGLTRHWSTWLNGNLFEEKAFKKEADKIFAHLKKQAAKKK